MIYHQFEKMKQPRNGIEIKKITTNKTRRIKVDKTQEI